MSEAGAHYQQNIGMGALEMQLDSCTSQQVDYIGYNGMMHLLCHISPVC